MNFPSLWPRTILAAGLALTALGPIACGGADDRPSFGAIDSTPAATQVAGGALNSVAAAGGADAAPSPLAGTEPVEAITVVVTDNAFGPAEFRVRAGELVAVTVENRGQAIHDWRVRGLAAADGKDAGSRLLMAGQSQSFTLTIDRPGDYTVYCEVHPVDMRAKLSAVTGQAGATTLTADR